MVIPEAVRMDGICRFRFEMGADCRITQGVKMPGLPPAQGLYDPAHEHDACGVGFVVHVKGQRSHAIVEQALKVLINLLHRGACGCEANTGDGAGILIQMPDRFFRREAPRLGFALPPERHYGAGFVFLPKDGDLRARVEALVEDIVREEGQRVLGWRDVPTDHSSVGPSAVAVEPYFRQLFVARGPAFDGLPDTAATDQQFERKLYVIRKRVEHAVDAMALPDRTSFYVPSLSSKTIIYKGMLTATQIAPMFPDLADPEVESALALVHQRFSTNTFPSWPLAHPYRFVAHNGEINALMGNKNWMRARESSLRSQLFGDDLEKLTPIVQAGNSDSATFDNVLELLHLAGRSVPHALMMMIPEAWDGREAFMSEEVRGFYQFHSCLMEPWDGPAVIAATDGHVIGATLDRNGLRPGRWMETRDGHVVLASETGAMPTPESEIVRKGRLHPGKLFLVDLDRHRIVDDEEIKHEVATQKPYAEWFRTCSVRFEDLPEKAPRVPRTEPLRTRQLAFGYSQEDLRVLLAPMAAEGAEPTGSMGNDLALAVLSDRAPSLFGYFKQLFAQVTNPAIDPIRENVVMSLSTGIGSELNVLEDSPEHAHQLVMHHPILRNAELEKLRQVSHEIFR